MVIMLDVTFLQEKKYSLLGHIHCVLNTYLLLVPKMIRTEDRIEGELTSPRSRERNQY